MDNYRIELVGGFKAHSGSKTTSFYNTLNEIMLSTPKNDFPFVATNKIRKRFSAFKVFDFVVERIVIASKVTGEEMAVIVETN